MIELHLSIRNHVKNSRCNLIQAIKNHQIYKHYQFLASSIENFILNQLGIRGFVSQPIQVILNLGALATCERIE